MRGRKEEKGRRGRKEEKGKRERNEEKGRERKRGRGNRNLTGKVLQQCACTFRAPGGVGSNILACMSEGRLA